MNLNEEKIDLKNKFILTYLILIIRNRVLEESKKKEKYENI